MDTIDAVYTVYYNHTKMDTVIQTLILDVEYLYITIFGVSEYYGLMTTKAHYQIHER